MSTETSQWRIRAWGDGDKPDRPRHTSTCRGDSSLNEALKDLERNPAITRIRVEPL